MADYTSADIDAITKDLADRDAKADAARKAALSADKGQAIRDLEAELAGYDADRQRLLAEYQAADEVAKKYQAEVFDPLTKKLEEFKAEWGKARNELERLRNKGTAGHGREKYLAANRSHWETHYKLQAERNQTRSMVQRHIAFGEEPRELSASVRKMHGMP